MKAHSFLIFILSALATASHASPCQDWLDTYRTNIVDVSSDEVGKGKAHLVKKAVAQGCDVDPNDFWGRTYKDPFAATLGYITEDKEILVKQKSYKDLAAMPIDSVLYFEPTDIGQCRCEKIATDTWICDPLI